MRNRMLSLLLIPLAMLSMAAACNPAESESSPKPQTLEEALAACGPECKVVTFVFSLLDEDMQPVGAEEGFEALYTLDGFQLDADGNPKQITVIDVTDQVETSTPYAFDYEIPSIHYEIASPSHVQISLEAVMLVPAGYTLQCIAKQRFGNIETIVSRGAWTNESGIVPGAQGAMGMPMDGLVYCSWPGLSGVPVDQIP